MAATSALGDRQDAAGRAATARHPVRITVYPNGDVVQTVVCWTPTNPHAEISAEAEAEIIRRINTGLPNGQRHSAANAAKERAAWTVVKELAPKLSEKRCRRVIEANGFRAVVVAGDK
jgi:hypothetical protein